MGHGGGEPAWAAADCPWGEAPLERTLSGLPALLPESMLALLELLDARGLSNLRRAVRLPTIAREAQCAELRAGILEMLTCTKFPFTHASYVLGLNGPYYSLDTTAGRHYGIPRQLPQLLCRLFRLSVPDTPFTTLRIQKFSASSNFGGQHRTLAFNLSSRTATPEADGEWDEAELGGEPEQPDPEVPERRGHVLCVTPGCLGGFGETSDNPRAAWRRLAGPQQPGRWVSFPMRAWLRWHWPRLGDLYAVTATCEPEHNCLQLRRRERTQMDAIGFLFPPGASPVADGMLEGSDAEMEDASDCDGCDAAPPVKQTGARAAAAKRILGLAGLVSPQEVEDAFRRAARAVHPDRAGHQHAVSGTWAMVRLVWARRVLRGTCDDADEDAPEEVLALPAPELRAA